MTFAFVSCEKDDKANDRYEQEEEEKDYEYLYTQTGLYLGITGFNSDLQHYTYRPAYYPSVDYYRLLNTSTSNSFKEFVSTLKTDDGTILYYAMDNTISLLEKSKFPDDLKKCFDHHLYRRTRPRFERQESQLSIGIRLFGSDTEPNKNY